MENLNQNTQEQEAPYTVPGAYNFEPECALPGTALTCLNGLRHGGRARMLFIPGEQPQDFFNMLLEDFETHKPATTQAGGIVTDATLARWFLWRRQRSYAKAEFDSTTSKIKRTLSILAISISSNSSIAIARRLNALSTAP